MTVRINKDALNLREELTKAQSVVPYSQQQFWMDGLVENGTFDNGTVGWTAQGSSLSVVNGFLRVTNVGGSNDYAYQIKNVLTAGKKYKFYFTIGIDKTGASNVYIGQGTTSSGLFDDYYAATGLSPGDYSGTFTAQSETLSIYLGSYSTDGVHVDYDNVAVFEVDENDNVIHSLPLGFKPLHVYEDGLIQREGDVHDYTVVKTGGAYAIKPAVQPTGATETCIIAEREL